MTAPTDRGSSVGAVSTADEADIVIHDAVVVTVDEYNRIFENGTVVIDDNVITEVRPTRDHDPTCGADCVINGDGKFVMPGQFS